MWQGSFAGRYLLRQFKPGANKTDRAQPVGSACRNNPHSPTLQVATHCADTLAAVAAEADDLGAQLPVHAECLHAARRFVLMHEQAGARDAE